MHRVVDGDTIKISGGRLVRYIGIDTPEIRKKIGDRWIEDPQPMGLKAKELNRKLVEGKLVRLEYDVQTHDRFGRLLAYVYVRKEGSAATDSAELMVNAELLRLGVAQLLTIPPNVRYVEKFRLDYEEARLANRGLWGSR